MTTIPQDRRSWMLGAVDAFNGNPERANVPDPLAYASGRVEGKAWRDQGADLSEMLKRNRLPHLVTDTTLSPGDNRPGEHR